jgi:hypothetical protein
MGIPVRPGNNADPTRMKNITIIVKEGKNIMKKRQESIRLNGS